jgi:alkylation response protein AidB-like acyl-CoA dehydrogenase
MMKFAGTEDHEQWVEKAQRLKPIFAERARALDEAGGSPRENMDLLRDEGFFKLVIPREYGGLGTAASWCSYTANTVLEIISSACGSTGWALTSQFHGSGLVVGLGDEEQKCRILGDVVNNGAQMASVGSEVRAKEKDTVGGKDGKLTFASELTPVDGGFMANGVKGFSSMAADAKYLCYWALAPGTDNPSVGVTVAVVETDDPGVTPLPGWEEAIGIRASLSGGTKFQDVFVPWRNILGQPGDHMQIHPYLFEINYTCLLLGIAQGVLDFVKQTVADRPFLQKDDTIMYAVGETASNVHNTRAAWWHAQSLWDAKEFDRAAHFTLMAQHQAKSTALAACDMAFEVVGVRALFKWNPVERAWRDARTITLHTRESLLMRLVAEAETNDRYFAKAKYGHRLAADERVTWESLGFSPNTADDVAVQR